LIGLGIIIIGGGVVGFLSQGLAVASNYDVNFPPSQELMEQWNSEYFSTALGFSCTMIPIHVSITILVLIAVFVFREPIIERLGLKRSSLPNWSYPALMLASPLSWIIGSLIVVYFVGEPSREWIKATTAFNSTKGFDAFVILTWGTLGASFAEEIFFRGYLLKGLIQRWNPWLSVLLTAIFFALIHGGLDLMLYSFPMGVYWGIIVWRTGSIWPAITCHAFNNILITFICRYSSMDSSEIWADPSFVEIIILIISVTAMIFTVHLLFLNTKKYTAK
jgi:membrane protease YdiL (CAAX protease family)